ncbi:hypothetical protein MKC97_08145 [[Clostridium] innocuum]|nr:hypothetical protein [[Clostridium] innocuum]
MNKIPKIIHYCWFGGSTKPDYVIKCIESWKEILPEYEIIEWNEDNFDIGYCVFSREAYEMKKYAFVSDITRLYALFHYGGIYLDTDVEVIKSFNDILENRSCILGYEIGDKIATSFIAAEKNNEMIGKFLKIYNEKKFISENNEQNIIPNVNYLTNLLLDRGLKLNGQYQELSNGIVVYPSTYFSPFDYINCVDDSNEQTYCIHHFAVSWLNKSALMKRKIKRIIVKFIGRNNLIKLRKIKNRIVKK